MRFRFCGFGFCFDWVWSKCSYAVCINMSCVLILYFQCIFDHSPSSNNINASGPEIFNLNVVPFLELKQFMWVVCLCFVSFRFVSSFLLRSAKLYFVPHCYGLGSVQSVSARDRLCSIVFFVCAIPVWLLPNPNEILAPFGHHWLRPSGRRWPCSFGHHWLCPFSHHWLCPLGHRWLCPLVITGYAHLVSSSNAHLVVTGYGPLVITGYAAWAISGYAPLVITGYAPLVISVMPLWSFR